MELAVREEGGIVFLKIKGHLDALSAPEADRAVEEALSGEHSRLLFDLAEMDYISSTGLRVILSAVKGMKQKGGEVALCAMNKYVKEVFDVSGLSPLFQIMDTVEDGVRILS